MMKIETSNNIQFSAKILSQWRCKNSKNMVKDISIIEIEKKDLPFMEKFKKYIKQLKTDTVKESIMSSASKTIIEILKSDHPSINKTKIFIAAHDAIPCGILIGNLPKIRTNNALVYSSRHNLAKNETEMDWLVTWMPNNLEIKGIGKALVVEFFKTLKTDKFRNVYVRSEIPEKSFAVNFYEKIGFERLGEKHLKLSNKNSAQSIINDYCQDDDKVLPMLITKSVIKKIIDQLIRDMNRQEFKKNSINAEELIKIQ